MKYLVLTTALLLANPFPLGSAPSEMIYTLTTDCNGHSPIESGFYSKECN